MSTAAATTTDVKKARRPAKCRFCKQALEEGVTFQEHRAKCADAPDPSAPKVCRNCGSTLADGVFFKDHNETCPKKPEVVKVAKTGKCSKCGAEKAQTEFSPNQWRLRDEKKCKGCVDAGQAERRANAEKRRAEEGEGGAAAKPEGEARRRPRREGDAKKEGDAKPAKKEGDAKPAKKDDARPVAEKKAPAAAATTGGAKGVKSAPAAKKEERPATAPAAKKTDAPAKEK